MGMKRKYQPSNGTESMKVKTICVIVELENGEARQVLASEAQKHIALKMLTHKDGSLKVTDPIKPIEFEFIKPQ